MANDFGGFPREGIKFLKDLRRNNNKEWFNRNKKAYEEHLVTPGRNFVIAMGEKLGEISPGLVADPAVNKSLFRLNRDTRFSSDKTPYKTQFSIFFWEGEGKRMENPGFYLCFDADQLTLAGGAHEFPREKLEPFRKAVVNDRSGPELVEVARRLKRNGLEIRGAHYKRVPRGYDPDHPRADFLKYNGLYIMSEQSLPDQLHRKSFTTYCLREFRKIDPLLRWLVKHL